MGAKQVDPTTAMEEIHICTMILTVAAHLECVWFCIDINILLCDDIVCWNIVCSVGANFVVLALAKLPTGRPPHIPETVSHKSMLEYSTAKDS